MSLPTPAYDSLYREHAARVLRLCRLLLRDLHEAEEVSQEVFLKLYREVSRRGGDMLWAAWLTRVTVNACHDRRRSSWWKWRRADCEPIEDLSFASPEPTPEAALLADEQRRRIWRAYAALSARQREVFVLRIEEGWSTEEVAQTLGIGAGSVKRHLFRAVRQLRHSLRGPT